MPELADEINDTQNCWDTLLSLVHERGLRAQCANHFSQFPSELAYAWAHRFPEDQADMKPMIKGSYWAYEWAYEFPEDKAEMKPMIKGSHWAYYWARKFPEDQDDMKPMIKGSEWAYYWACKFPEDKDEMKKLMNKEDRRRFDGKETTGRTP